MFDSKILFPAVLLLRLAISYSVIPPSHPTASASEMTYIVSSGALNSTHSLTQLLYLIKVNPHLSSFFQIDIIPIASRSSRFFYHASSSSHYNSNPLFTPFLLLAGGVELNPGPSSAYTLCTLNIRSLLNNSHAIASSDIAESHRPDLFCLTETWIKPTTTSAELIDPRTPRSQKSSQNIGGGTAWFPSQSSVLSVALYCFQLYLI